jgi:hypothetical protein
LHGRLGGFNHLEKYEFVNGKDYSIYYGKEKMFETTNQYFWGDGWNFQMPCSLERTMGTYGNINQNSGKQIHSLN